MIEAVFFSLYNKTTLCRDRSTINTTQYRERSAIKTTLYRDRSAINTTLYRDRSTRKTTLYRDRSAIKTTLYRDRSTRKTTLYRDRSTRKTTCFQSQTFHWFEVSLLWLIRYIYVISNTCSWWTMKLIVLNVVCMLYYRQSTQAIEEQKVAEEELAGEVTTANSRIQEIENELCSINEQLGEAKVRNLNCWNYI